ncbi:uncharacterized protein SPSK_02630 [Sporothrix schenckii 1099-18]|uniref:Uncharacterized protein n=1 Tax=Sporothrix schenckii 1099-18 TaxID=1397361 RepID=A0A0F2MBI9_SPOSC|nr:uncharacterized protein SPSK_02630 [Sporothrix schenckii 1099-18]KJR86205.1 hypothetical protein SPSK_02630 [Sporothrix schenckii 1099-18]
MPPPLRGPASGGWGLLRPVNVDPLEVYGLPSKGETRLSDFKLQERYYGTIVQRYLQFCNDANDRNGLLARFASLELSGKTTGPSPTAPTAPSDPLAVVPTAATTAALAAATRDLTLVLAALRKLREAIVATGRVDDFSTQVYLFCIRLAILAKHPQSYHPAILHLLRSIHRHRPLSTVELHEVAAYRVLDAACRRGDLAEAYHLRCLYKLRNATVDTALRALARDDWVALRRLVGDGASGGARGGCADGHLVKLLEYAVHDVRVHTLKCFGRAYLRLEDVGFLEASAGLGWAELQKQYNVGWELDGKAVVIRKMQPKTQAPAGAAGAAKP